MPKEQTFKTARQDGRRHRSAAAEPAERRFRRGHPKTLTINVIDATPCAAFGIAVGRESLGYVRKHSHVARHRVIEL